MNLANIIESIKNSDLPLDDLIQKIKKIISTLEFLMIDLKIDNMLKEVLLFLCMKLRQKIEYIAICNSESKNNKSIKHLFNTLIKKEYHQ